ncbi:MAG: helix-turn-helix domain-containing protein [Candidatus Neomarinimicrobiota bacterium]
MEPFYQELKKLREENNIDLAEIHNRTKIDMSYLHAIEEGQFDVLPRTYMRLFLRAYVTEIGGDTKDALNQLDHHLSQIEGIEYAPAPVAPEQPEFGGSETSLPYAAKPPKKLAGDYIKGAILIVVVLFAIIIIKQISSGDSEAVGGQATLRVDDSVNPVTREDLIFNYTQLAVWNETFEAKAPFTMRLAAQKNVWYRLIVDQKDTLAGVLAHDRDLLLEFSGRVDLLTDHAVGVSVAINGNSVRNMGSHPYPVELIFETDPNRVNIIHYTPNQ